MSNKRKEVFHPFDMVKKISSDEIKFKRVDEIKNHLGVMEACAQVGVKYASFYKWKRNKK